MEREGGIGDGDPWCGERGKEEIVSVKSESFAGALEDDFGRAFLRFGPRRIIGVSISMCCIRSTSGMETIARTRQRPCANKIE